MTRVACEVDDVIYASGKHYALSGPFCPNWLGYWHRRRLGYFTAIELGLADQECQEQCELTRQWGQAEEAEVRRQAAARGGRRTAQQCRPSE
jgi:hypothetical protein